jgi:hypothetical protein
MRRRWVSYLSLLKSQKSQSFPIDLPPSVCGKRPEARVPMGPGKRKPPIKVLRETNLQLYQGMAEHGGQWYRPKNSKPSRTETLSF